MSDQESGVPGGWGAQKGVGGGRVIEPVVPPTVGGGDGTYTDKYGNQTNVSSPGQVDAPGEATKKMVAIGGIGGRGGSPGSVGGIPPQSLDQIKQNELRAAYRDNLLRQSIAQTTPEEAAKIQAMVRNKASFAPGAGQRGVDISSKYVSYEPDEKLSVSEIRPEDIGVESKQYNTQGNKIESPIVSSPIIKSDPVIFKNYPAQEGSIAAQYQVEKDKMWLPEGIGGTKPLPKYVAPHFDIPEDKLSGVRKRATEEIQYSEALQTKYEDIIGYNKETSGIGKTLLAGAGQFITSIPAFASQVEFVAAAIATEPKKVITGLPTGVVMFGKQMGEQIVENPVKFTGMVIGGHVLMGGGVPKSVKNVANKIGEIKVGTRPSGLETLPKGTTDISIISKKRHVTMTQAIERPSAALDKPVETLDLTGQSQASFVTPKKTPPYEAKVKISQGNSYGKYKTQYDIASTKAPVKLMTQAERDLVIAKIKGTEMVAPKLKTSYETDFAKSQGNAYGTFKTQFQSELNKPAVKLLSQAERNAVIEQINLKEMGAQQQYPLSKMKSALDSKYGQQPKSISESAQKPMIKTDSILKSSLALGVLSTTRMDTAQVQSPIHIQSISQKNTSLLAQKSTQKQDQTPSIQSITATKLKSDTIQQSTQRQDIIQNSQFKLDTTPSFKTESLQELKKTPIQETRIDTILKTPMRTPTRTTPTPKPKIPKKPTLKLPSDTIIEKTSKKNKKDITAEDIMNEPSQVLPWYPASLENVTKEEMQLGGKRAKHIKSKKTTQKLFTKLQKTGVSIPTAKQFKSNGLI